MRSVYLIVGGGFAARKAQRTLRREGLAVALAPVPLGGPEPAAVAVRVDERDQWVARSILARGGQPVRHAIIRQ